MDKIFLLLVKNREKIIYGFKLLYVLLILLSFLGTISTFRGDSFLIFFNQLGLWAGKIAIPVYILTIIPGIARRFSFQHKLISLLMIFRRYVGITMYLLVLFHFMMMRGVEWFLLFVPLFPMPIYQLFGFLAHDVLLLLALTSNDISTKKLGVWWNRIHDSTYIVIFLIFLHVALQTLSIWTILIALALILQVSSFIYKRYRDKEAERQRTVKNNNL